MTTTTKDNNGWPLVWWLILIGLLFLALMLNACDKPACGCHTVDRVDTVYYPQLDYKQRQVVMTDNCTGDTVRMAMCPEYENTIHYKRGDEVCF